MQNVILFIHILACVTMVGVVLLQRSEGGALGIGGGGSGLMSARGAAGTLVRMTMIIGGIFLATSLALTVIANRSSEDSSVLDAAGGIETTGSSGVARSVDDISAPLFDEEESTSSSADNEENRRTEN